FLTLWPHGQSMSQPDVGRHASPGRHVSRHGRPPTESAEHRLMPRDASSGTIPIDRARDFLIMRNAADCTSLSGKVPGCRRSLLSSPTRRVYWPDWLAFLSSLESAGKYGGVVLCVGRNPSRGRETSKP
ncbi:hypothetical protein TCAP_03164, partial [Tolypocladium capitatum]